MAKRRARLASFISALICSLVVGFGCSPSAGTPVFDEEHAFNLLKKQVEFGPRYPGIAAHGATADFIISQLKPHADEVTTQQFSQKVAGKTIDLKNIIAKFSPDARKIILLAAHWDTRPMADMEVDPVKRAKPILGANDGASGVAVLLELARMFGKQRPDVGVIMVFFDGEDYTPNPPTSRYMFLGSKYYASRLDSKTKQAIEYGILLDMIGDKDLRIHQEINSVQAAPEVVRKIWDTARQLGYSKQFVPEAKYAISDDHLPLIAAGVKCIDVIDFDYGPWHTVDDTVDKCSPQSLKTVGDVIACVVYEEKAQ